MQIAVLDSYDNVSVLSIYWKSDDNGGAEDNSLFIQTLSKLWNVQTCQQSLSDDHRIFRLGAEVVDRAASQSGSRKLFILLYAGRANAGSTYTRQLHYHPQNQSGAGVLMMNSCCAAIAGRGGKAKGARVELVVATAPKDVGNSRKVGRTYTQHCCQRYNSRL